MGKCLHPVHWAVLFATTVDTLPDADWTPIRPSLSKPHLSKCSLRNQPNDTSANGQWIKPVEQEDGRLFHCLNRGDENPFAETRRNTEDGSKKTWMDWVNTPCEKGKKYRRCLGQRPDQCVWAECKEHC